MYCYGEQGGEFWSGFWGGGRRGVCDEYGAGGGLCLVLERVFLSRFFLFR